MHDEEPPRIGTAVMTSLEPSASHALAVWRHELETARAGHGPDTPEQVEGRRLVVLVRYRGDPPDWRDAGMKPGFDSGGLVSGSIRFADLERLGDLPGVVSVAMQPNLNPALDGTVAEMKMPWKDPSGGGFTGRGTGVIVAVIDTGIDIFHESFVKADGTTRIAELWDQTAGLTGGSNPPAAFLQQGQVYSAAQINAALTAGPPFASKDTNGHGTHVAGIAAGSGRQEDRCSFPGLYVGVAPDADLVIVKAIEVPNNNVTDALNWCAQATTRLPGTRPVVINCSFGHDIGPHDGTDVLDVAFDALLRPASGPPAGLAVVVAAGNQADADIHETGTIPANGTVTVPFYVRHRSRQPDTMDIWYNGTAALTVELTAPANPAFPGTNTTGPVTPSATNSPVNRVIGGMTLVVTSTQPLPAHNGKREIQVSLTITPPAVPPPAGTTPPVVLRGGAWQLKLTETAGVAANWEAWFATSHTDPFPTWRMPDDPETPVPRRRENTVGSPGTMRNGITVAAYSDDDGELAPFSSRGASSQVGLPVGEFKPTIAAPGVAVAAARSQDNPESNSSCCDQKVIDLDGTSMASPHVAGLVAVIFEKNKRLTFEQVRAHLQHSARIDGIPAAEVPPVVDAGMNIRANALWGSGKVDARAALNEIPPASALSGGGGGGGVRMALQLDNAGYTPHTLGSRLGDWHRRFGDHPGVMLLASLVSEHVDEVLWLINHDRRITVAWRRGGGHLLVRQLLHGPVDPDVLIPAEVHGLDVGSLLAGFTTLLGGLGGERLRCDVGRFGGFARLWPGATLAELDRAALEFAGPR
jgi:subtilisin family serine protease